MVNKKFTSTDKKEFTSPICNECKHQNRRFPDRCAAFKLAIPIDILTNKVSHKKAYPGDNGIQFEEKV